MKHQPQPHSAHDHQQHEHAHDAHAHHASVPEVEFDLAAVHALAVLPPTLTASIFLPTHRAGSDTHQDHIRLKNLLHQARSLLIVTDDVSVIGESANAPNAQEKQREARADAILAPALALLETPAFWAHPQDGLALFCSDQGLQKMWLPAAMPELVVVGVHCHVKPLMPLLQGGGDFYLLELTQHGVLLHAGSRFGLRPLTLAGAPDSLEASSGNTHGQPRSEMRTLHGSGHGSGLGAGDGAGVYRGADGDEDSKERIKHFFRGIDASVCGVLHAQRAPLVTAGVGYLLPLYWEVNRYPFLIQSGISSNTDLITIGALHDRAWEIVAPHFSKADDQARDRYGELHGTSKASNDLATVLRAVHQGRVDDIFIASDTERWGTFDPLTDKLREHESRAANDADLLNTALIQALATRARTQVIPRAQMPGGSSDIAAVFRY